MADRSSLKSKLKYHRLVVLSIVLAYIWIQYEYSSGNLSYSNGQPKINGQHTNGKDEGQWTWFYSNGKKQMQGSFLNGKREGLWILWDTNGNKLSESTYTNDKLNGKFTHWYSNSVVESEGTYEDDKLISASNFNPDGSVKKTP